MGDPARFRLFAEVVDAEFSRFRHSSIADVAGGKGHLKAALYMLGFRNVTTIDKRHKNANGRPGQKYAYFDYNSGEHYSLILGMHPDDATDHIILYAAKHKVPFAICPCCIKPSAAEFSDRPTKRAWIQHLIRLATKSHIVSVRKLTMEGDNLVLLGASLR